MTEYVGSNVDIEKLRRLYVRNETAKAMLDLFAGRERSWGKTNVSTILNKLKVAGYICSRGEVVHVFKELESVSAGKFKAGRKGHPSRFEWAVSQISVGQVAAEEGESFEIVEGEEAEPEEEEASISESGAVHRLIVRLGVAIELPIDLTTTEAERLATLVRAIPFGE